MSLSEAASSTGFFGLVPLIVFIPILGLVINIAFGDRLGERVVGWLASAAAALAFLVAVLLGISLAGHPEGVTVPFAEWIKIGSLDLSWAFRVDTLSVTMMLVVAGVGTLIHIYAIGYMFYDVRYKEDPGRYRRFFVYMNLFIAAMMILVSGDNYVMLFVGWEGVGLCSFLLIGFWTGRNPDGTDGIGNAMAAKKAFVTNRIGDFGFLIAIFLMFWAFGTLQFGEVFEAAHHVAEESPTVILLITLFMLVGVTGKSAQLPLYVWLPDAMAGPTPVSALIHAATMVTAGVYLVARSAPLYEAVPAAQNTVALVGGLTALFAATIAVGQFDIKKVLAYSTISQLGFMVAAVGMGAFVAGMFHLVTHAFFKALLFLSAGSVIIGLERGHHPLESAGDGGHAGAHAGDHHEDHDPSGEHEHLFDPNDMRNMGGLRHKMPRTFWVFLAGALALAGLPPLAGFFSKDEILAEASLLNPTVYILLTMAAFLTAFYMGRQVWMVFFGSARSEGAEQAKESPALMTVPLLALALLSVFGGGLNLPGVHWFTDWLEHTIEHAHAGEFNVLVAGISTGLALLAIFLAWLLYGRSPLQKGQTDPLRRLLGPLFVGMEHKWWVDELYWTVILNPYIALAKFLADIVDWQFWHDWFHDTVLYGSFNAISRWSAVSFDLGVIDAIANGLGGGTQSLAASLRRIQTGYVRNYALSVFIGVVVLVGYLILR
jgi:NADH-quinone oxidoreductase subunit L